MSNISQLANLISTAVQTLQDSGFALPVLEDTWTPASEAFRAEKSLVEAANVIIAASLQLAATLLPTPVMMYETANGHLKSAALRVALETNTAEILREAGPKGLHVQKIAEKAGVDPGKLGRTLRFLSTLHIFQEVSPDVFANNRLSSIFDTGKLQSDIVSKPGTKFDDTTGLTAFLSLNTDQTHKSSAGMYDHMIDPKTRYSQEPNETPFGVAHNTTLHFHHFLELPGQEARRNRFDIGMRGIATLYTTSLIPASFDWSALPPRSVVVDVGGGIGTSSAVLARDFKHIDIVIQDQPATLQQGRDIWSQTMPEEIASGRVNFQEHDFFTPQPVTNAAVFYLKHIIHNWADTYATRILTELRKAALPTTRLIAAERVMVYLCPTPTVDADIPGSTGPVAPPPLLPNYGGARSTAYYMDIAMYMSLNSQERTFGEFQRLFSGAGWKIVKVHNAAEELQFIEAIPI